MYSQKISAMRAGLVAIMLMAGSIDLYAQVAETSVSVLASTTALRVTPLDPTLDPTLLTAEAKRLADHPLQKALHFATEHYDYIRQNVNDYTSLLVRRERIAGQLRGYEYIKLKIREQRETADKGSVPFSAYLKFLKPDSVKNREVLYLRGHNDGDMLVRNGGKRLAFLNLWLDPAGDIALRDNRYPITDLGLENLILRLIEVAEAELKYDECEVKVYDHAKIDGQLCTAVEVLHPVPRDHFRFHLARIFVDKELHVPVRFACYAWPNEGGGKLPLLEEYTYRKLKLNVGLTDEDFTRNHPDYGFKKES
jgi:hypothetical protein